MSLHRRWGLSSLLALTFLSLAAPRASANTVIADCVGWRMFSDEIPENGTAYLTATAILFLQTGVNPEGLPVGTQVGSPMVKCAIVPDVDSNPNSNDTGYDLSMAWDPPPGAGTYFATVQIAVYIIDDPLNTGFDMAFWESMAATCQNPDLQDPAPARRRRDKGTSTPFTCEDEPPPPPEGANGCTPGFWKQPHHFFAWPASISPNDLFVTVFGENAFPGLTLFQVLWLTGGGLPRLGSHSVAALLNASTLGSSYGLTPAQVIAMFQAVHPGTKDAYNGLKDTFEDLNEQGCPFGSEGSGGALDEELVLRGPPTFRRGDANVNGSVDIGDVLFILEGFFVNAEAQPSCADAADVNDDGHLDVSDPIGLLHTLFKGAAPLRFPGSHGCGMDLAVDDLPTCAYATACFAVRE